MEWLDGFETVNGKLAAKVISPKGTDYLRDFGQLRGRGLPTEISYNPERAFISDFFEWSRVPPHDYLQGVGLGSSAATARHEVFHIRHGVHDYLIPALALLRGMLPLIPEAFEYLFTPRNLELLCTPLERNGHWSVGLPDFRGLYKGRFRPSTMEALTWVSLFPSARKFWASAYQNMCAGNVCLSLPRARVKLLPTGIRRGRTVYVTSVQISAVLALDAPFGFANGASSSFLWDANAAPIAPGPNAYYEQGKQPPETQPLNLTDTEWEILKPICTLKGITHGRKPTHPRRIIANCVLLRLATTLRWKDIAIAPLSHQALIEHWKKWRKSRTLDQFVSAMRELRPDAEYLRHPNHYREISG